MNQIHVAEIKAKLLDLINKLSLKLKQTKNAPKQYPELKN